MQCCPICNQPIENSNHPEADVYHMSCLMVVMRPQREKVNRTKTPATLKQEGNQ